MEDLESFQEEDDDLTVWDRFKKLSDKKILLTDKGKATVSAAVGTPILFEGIAHMGNTGIAHMGNIGLGVSIAATILGFMHGDKAFQAGRWIKGKIVEDNGLQPSSSEERTLSLKEKFLKDNGLQPQPERDFSLLQHPSSNRQRDEGILLGHDKRGKEVRRTMEQLKSILILGVPGKGKTSTAAWIISQYIALGAELVILDRNARSPEGLAYKLAPFERAFTVSPADNPKSMLEVLDLAKSRLQDRIDREEESDHPFLLVIDEATDLFAKAKNDGEWKQVGKKAMEIVEEFNAMGRKFKCFAICIGQLANASRTGGTEIRELFATRIIHGMKASQASMVLPRNLIEEAPRLGNGEAFLDDEGTSDPFKIKIPYLTDDRVQEIVSKISHSPISKLNSLSFPAQNTKLLPETETEMPSGNTKIHEMYDNNRSISGHMEIVPDTFASTTQELVNFLENSGKCPDALLLVREQTLRFASGTEDRTISQIAKDWGFESGRGWQKTTGLLETFKSVIEAQEEL